MTVDEQLRAGAGDDVRQRVVGKAAVETLRFGLDVFHPEVQPGRGGSGSQGGPASGVHQRPREAPRETLGRVRGGGAVEGHGGAAVRDQRAVGQRRGRHDG